jgi:hypothetical protein
MVLQNVFSNPGVFVPATLGAALDLVSSPIEQTGENRLLRGNRRDQLLFNHLYHPGHEHSEIVAQSIAVKCGVTRWINRKPRMPKRASLNTALAFSYPERPWVQRIASTRLRKAGLKWI